MDIQQTVYALKNGKILQRPCMKSANLDKNPDMALMVRPFENDVWKVALSEDGVFEQCFYGFSMQDCMATDWETVELTEEQKKSLEI